MTKCATRLNDSQQKLSIYTFNSQNVDLTCACAAYDAVVNDRTAVDRNLQAVVCIVMLGRLIIRIELQ